MINFQKLFNRDKSDIETVQYPIETFQDIEIKKQRLIDDEYNLIKGNFLNEIKTKIIYFKEVFKICSDKCIQEKCKNDQTMCSQINSMMQERPTPEFVTLCRNTAVTDNVKQICSIANTIEDTIEKLFISYKKDYKDKPHNENYDKIILTEKKFYDFTKSKLKSGEYNLLLEEVSKGLKQLPAEVNMGGRRKRLTKGKKYYKKSKKNTKSKKRKQKFIY